MTWPPALFAILTACGATNDPWDDPNYLLGSSVLDRALDLSQTPRGAHDEAVLCVSTSGWGVDMRCRPFAHGVSTFDLHETKGGLLLFVGLNLRRWGHDHASLGHAYALTTPDLERFGSRIWEVRDTKLPFLTDLSLEDLPDGRRRMVYVSGGADAPGVHTVRAALGRGDDWREAEPALYADEGLLDPSTCSAGGTYHLFATKHHAIVHATGTDPWHYAEDPAFTWIGAQVPSCFDDAGTLTVVAQAGGGWGAPVLRTLDKDGGFSAPRPLWPRGRYPDLASCTSPVLRHFREQYVLICAVSRLSQAAHETKLDDVIPGDLERIWMRPLPADQRRHALFTYWDRHADSPTGKAAQDAIRAFLNAEVQTSKAPFTASELRVWNATRSSKEPLTLDGVAPTE